MITIRLARVGRKNLAWFKLVVQQKHVSPKSAKYIAVLGSYNPSDAANKVTGLDTATVEKYLANGAQVSATAARLLVKNGVAAAQKFVTKYAHKIDPEKVKAEAEARKKAAEEAKAKAEAEAAAKAAAEAPAETAAEAPAEEAPAA